MNISSCRIIAATASHKATQAWDKEKLAELAVKRSG